ncbi:MAG: hypothetical protein M1282_14510, partial [Chloroflexi bacterium]|nr:hypothetical protein [Chloroflexota bacterium]
RAIWILVAYYAAGNYAPNPSYEAYFQRGYFLTRIFPLDIFSRWDGRWYLSIIKAGYQPPANWTGSYSNFAFFPLYPYLVKSIGWLGLHLPDGFYILVGLLLSNLCFLAAAVLLYRLIVLKLGFEESSAQRTLGLLFVFPVGFFFSAFYPESLFFVLTVAGFTFALEEKWFWTAICAALVIVTKPSGIVPVFALGWLYMEKRQWRIKDIKLSAGWFLLAPIALFLHFYYLYLKSGHLFAFSDAMKAWGGLQTSIFRAPLQNLSGPSLDVFKIDFIWVILFLVCSFYILRKWPIKAFGIFAALMVILSVATGLLVSVSRFLLVTFPVFILLGEKLKRQEWYNAALAVCFALQVIYFAGWINYYWIA